MSKDSLFENKKFKAWSVILLCTTIVAIVAYSFDRGSTKIDATKDVSYFCEGNIRLKDNGDGSYDVIHVGSQATNIDLTTLPYRIKTVAVDTFKDCKNTLTSVTIDSKYLQDNLFSNFTNPLDITITGKDAITTSFINTPINTLTISKTISTISIDTFKKIPQINTLNYLGKFNTFYNYIFPNLWSAITTNYRENSSIIYPQTIEVSNVSYDCTDCALYIPFIIYQSSRSGFGYYNTFEFNF